MKRRDLIKRLEKEGWKLSSGAKHDMVKNPNNPALKSRYRDILKLMNILQKEY